MKGSGDLEPLGKVASRYASGADDDVVEEVLQSLRDLLDECRRQAERIKRLPRNLCPEHRVTPELAGRRGLHPLVVAIDEVQELFGHKQYGAEAGDLAERIIKLGRAFGVILLLATQRPDKDRLPTGITANVGTRLALRVTDQITNDLVLGTSAYKQGLRATMFGPADKGVAYLRVLASHKSSGASTSTRLPPIASATAHGHFGRRPAPSTGTRSPGRTAPRAPTYNPSWTTSPWCLNQAKTPFSEILCQRLAELRPGAYDGWALEALARALKPLGVATKQIGRRVDGQTVNRRGVFLADLTAARQARELPRGDSTSAATASSTDGGRNGS